ncbi:rpc53, partial [Mucuna pruriens]
SLRHLSRGPEFETFVRQNRRFFEFVVLFLVLLNCKAMDPDLSSSRARKVKFTPKPPPNRKPKLRASKTVADEDSPQARALLRRYENLAKREPKVERKSSVEVAFSPAGSSPSLRTYGTSSGSPSKYFANEQTRLRCSSAATEDQNDTYMIDATDDTTNAPARKIKGKYKEPWHLNLELQDYDHSYYPTTLPLRKPNSGDPEILDEEEFGEAATSVEYDENAGNPAAELGLGEKSEQQRMLFFKFPPTLPLEKQSNKGKEQIGTSTVLGEPTKSKGSALEELSGGYMGKMLVYKSGAIKLKLGEALFDVSPGSNCVFTQDIVVMNTAQKQCCNLGELSKMVVVVPDLDSIEL